VRVALLHRLEDRYRKLGAYEGFFREAREIKPVTDVRLSHPVRVVDVHWPSDYQCFLPEVQADYEQAEENRIATARLVLHETPRPVLVLIHGYLGGAHNVERRIWPMSFFRRLGMDLALFVLPFHGSRGSGAFGELPPFPGADPRMTNEGFRQAMGDLRDFVRWLREQGHPKVGVMGMSLGGYATALAATVEPSLSFAVPIIPLASIPDVARLNGHLGHSDDESEAQHRGLVAVHRMASPLHRPPVIDSRSILVIGAERDQITPITQARKLAEHFGCRLETMHGGHLVQFGRGARFKSIGRFLTELGVVAPGQT